MLETEKHFLPAMKCSLLSRYVKKTLKSLSKYLQHLLSEAKRTLLLLHPPSLYPSSLILSDARSTTCINFVPRSSINSQRWGSLSPLSLGVLGYTN